MTLSLPIHKLSLYDADVKPLIEKEISSQVEMCPYLNTNNIHIGLVSLVLHTYPSENIYII